jgi:integrase/recombinase XerD
VVGVRGESPQPPPVYHTSRYPPVGHNARRCRLPLYYGVEFPGNTGGAKWAAMARKGELGIRQKQRKLRAKPALPARERVTDPAAGNLLRSYQSAFLEWTVTSGLSASTASIRRRALDSFIVWCDERGLARPQDITRPILQRYQGHLYHYRKANGAPLSFNTQATRLMPIVAYFKWCARESHILNNPASDLVLPKPLRQLPRHLMSVAEIEAVLNQAGVTARCRSAHGPVHG